MRVLNDKDTRRLLDAAAKITAFVEPMQARIAALESEVSRLSRIEAAARAAGSK